MADVGKPVCTVDGMNVGQQRRRSGRPCRGQCRDHRLKETNPIFELQHKDARRYVVEALPVFDRRWPLEALEKKNQTGAACGWLLALT